MTTLGSRIKLARGTESQDSFAGRLQISKGALGFYERDENLPKVDAVLKICSLAQVSLEWLLTGHGDMRPSVNREEGVQSGETDSFLNEVGADISKDTPTAFGDEQGERVTCSTGTAVTLISYCPRCLKLEKRLEILEQERRELSFENRKLWRQLSDLREEAAVLRERQKI